MSIRFRRGEGTRLRGSRRYGFAIAAAMVLVSLAGVSRAAGVFESYRQALAAYRSGHYTEAETLFSAIIQRDEPQPETLKSHYFLARTKMKLKKWDQASTLLRGIYSTSPAFTRSGTATFSWASAGRRWAMTRTGVWPDIPMPGLVTGGTPPAGR